jgi:hypothetical protein
VATSETVARQCPLTKRMMFATDLVSVREEPLRYVLYKGLSSSKMLAVSPRRCLPVVWRTVKSGTHKGKVLGFGVPASSI